VGAPEPRNAPPQPPRRSLRPHGHVGLPCLFLCALFRSKAARRLGGRCLALYAFNIRAAISRPSFITWGPRRGAGPSCPARWRGGRVCHAALRCTPCPPHRRGEPVQVGHALLLQDSASFFLPTSCCPLPQPKLVMGTGQVRPAHHPLHQVKVVCCHPFDLATESISNQNEGWGGLELYVC